jgi:hypothetical protein
MTDFSIVAPNTVRNQPGFILGTPSTGGYDLLDSSKYTNDLRSDGAD